MLMRQASYPLWLEAAQPAYFYQVNYSARSASGDDLDRLVPCGEYKIVEPYASWAVGNSTASSGSFGITGATSCTYPPIAYDLGTGPCEYLYLPSGAALIVNIAYDAGTRPATDPGLNLSFDVWDSPGQVQQKGIAFGLTYPGSGVTVGWYAYTSLRNQWIRPNTLTVESTTYAVTNANFSLTLGVLCAATYTVTTQASVAPVISGVAAPITCLFPYAAPAEFASSALPYQSTRLTAVAVLCTNVTKIQNKEGTVSAARLNPANTNVWNFTASTLAAVHPAEKQLLPLETGFYTYCPPSTDLANFWDYSINTANGAASCPAVRLDNDALVNCFSFSDPDGGTSLAINLDYHIEFRTVSALWNIGLSTIPLESLHTSQLSLVSVGFFFPNDTHETLRQKVVPKISTALATLAPALGLVHPMAGAAARAGSMMLSKKPRPTPPPTTAQAAGWLGSKAKVAMKQMKGKSKGGKQGKKQQPKKR
jgi:hypothetical protein